MANKFVSELKEKLKEAKQSTMDSLNDQQWFQELKAKWEEIDPQSRSYLKLASLAGAALCFIVLVISSVWSVSSTRAELLEKRALLTLLQSAHEQTTQLRDSVLGRGSQPSLQDSKQKMAWPSYFSGLAGTSGLSPSSVNVMGEKSGVPGQPVKEDLFSLELKHINIRQLVRFGFSLETGSQPVKLRNLLIDTKGDFSGYLDATLAVSAFTVEAQTDSTLNTDEDR